MIQFIDDLVLPVNPRNARAIVDAFGAASHVGLLRLARNQCWREWHSSSSMWDRCQARLGYVMLQRALCKALDADVRPLIDSIWEGKKQSDHD